ncbi:RHS repeat domain-containing protein [Agrilutibacter solisilvae]|uniref:RHS repeat-associated core domain-containing protein n=1 Tax=Agrilutibacter solisilvae TaxID=2763317 RepID=A0A974XXA8_9GAMM|nr:RHS repeat-associated core domain-containing protein [Lysobacter solisilvae]QSX77504.1 RHS repeat-associated core domain-containing protein [Lysobacter solisilvae]
MPLQVTKGAVKHNFRYAPLGGRIEKKSSDGKRTVYMAGLYERRTVGSTSEHVYMVPGEDGAAAQVTRTCTGSTNCSEKISYLTRDQLGSSSAAFNDNGDVEAQVFDPWGKRVFHTGGNTIALLNEVKHGFTKQRHEDELGWIDMNARMYDPIQRRFISPDPILADPMFSTGRSPYTYVRNNPMRYTDPTGLYETEQPDTKGGNPLPSASASVSTQDSCKCRHRGEGSLGKLPLDWFKPSKAQAGSPVEQSGGGGGGRGGWGPSLSDAPSATEMSQNEAEDAYYGQDRWKAPGDADEGGSPQGGGPAGGWGVFEDYLNLVNGGWQIAEMIRNTYADVHDAAITGNAKDVALAGLSVRQTGDAVVLSALELGAAVKPLKAAAASAAGGISLRGGLKKFQVVEEFMHKDRLIRVLKDSSGRTQMFFKSLKNGVPGKWYPTRGIDLNTGHIKKAFPTEEASRELRRVAEMGFEPGSPEFEAAVDKVYEGGVEFAEALGFLNGM